MTAAFTLWFISCHMCLGFESSCYPRGR